MATGKPKRTANSTGKGKGSSLAQIIVGVAIALIAGSSSPWWWSKVFPPRPVSSVENNETPAECPKGYFYLQSRATDLFLDLDNEGRLVQSREDRAPTQVWTTIPRTEKGYCYLTTKSAIDVNRDDCLEIRRGHPDDNAGIGRRRTLNSDDQQWTFEEVQPGYYVITSKVTGYAIDVPWGDAGKTLLILWPATGRNNQQWKLIPF